MSKTIVLGLGEIGKPLYNLIVKSGADVTGIDIEPVAVTGAVGVMHVCYPFQLEKGFIQITVDYIERYKPSVVIINSTVMPGTTAEIEKVSGVPVVYSPVRGKHTKMEEELLHYNKFIAGLSAEGVQLAETHFQSIGMKTRLISKPDTLELSKLLETTYFGLLISWAQELERLAVGVGGDYSELVQLFEEVSYLPPYVFQPGFIGGHCVMPNIKLLKSRFESDFLNAIEQSNNKKAEDLKGNEEKLKERIAPISIN